MTLSNLLVGIIVVTSVLIPSPVRGQGSLQIFWNHDDLTPTVAQAAIFRFYMNNQAGLMLDGVRCGLVNNITECNAPLPIPVNGIHTVCITVEISGSGESAKSNTITFRWPSAAPPKVTKVIKI